MTIEAVAAEVAATSIRHRNVAAKLHGGGYWGVSLHQESGRWCSSCVLRDGAGHHVVGYYDTMLEAALAYDKHAWETSGWCVLMLQGWFDLLLYAEWAAHVR